MFRNFLRTIPSKRQRITTGLCFFLAAMLGLRQAFQLYSVNFVLGRGAFWQDPPPDTAQMLIALRYFEAEPWHWPLTHIATLDMPDGISVANTGAPLPALLAKLLAPLFGGFVNPLGFYTVIIMVLQPVAMVWLLRRMEVRHPIGLLCGAVMALSFPPFLFRIFHIALMGQFLILFALGLYWAAANRPGRGVWIGFVLLVLLTTLIYAYLALMVDGILAAAALLDLLRTKRLGCPGLRALAVSAVGSFLLLWSMEYFAIGGGTFRASGFGAFSMNLLSPVIPQMDSLLPTADFGFLGSALRTAPPPNSLAFPHGDFVLDATGGQYEGMNYLGAGVLLLLVLAGLSALLRRRAWPASAVRPALPLLALCVLFTALAVTNDIYVAAYHVHIGLPVPAALLDQFRSSGRIFWPVGYMLVAGAIFAACRLMPPRIAGAALIVAAGLQYADAADLRSYVLDMTRTPGPATLPAVPWRSLVAAHRGVTIYPIIHCAALPAQLKTVDLLIDASEHATPINTMYAGRPADDCVASAQAARATVLDDGDLHIFFDEQFGWGAIRQLAGASSLCRKFDGGFACTSKWPALDAAGGLPGFSAPESPAYRLGTVVTLGDGAGLAERGWGWWRDSWMYGGKADLVLDLAAPLPSQDLTLHFRGHAALPDGAARDLSLAVDGVEIKQWRISDQGTHEFDAVIPAGVITRQSPLQLQFSMTGGKSLRELRLDTDNRRLDFSMEHFSVTAPDAT